MGDGKSSELISVIIPAYNAQWHLDEAIGSVVAQNYPNFEVIVVNDGSVDFTQKIAEKFANIDSRVKVVNTDHKGLSAARNIGIEYSNGSWVTFLDCDDLLYPDALVTLYQAASKSGCKISVGRVVRKWNPGKRTGSKFTVLSADDAIKSTLYQTSWLLPSACGKLYGSDLFTLEKFTEGIWYEDIDFFYRAYLEVGRIAVTDVPVYFYYKNPFGMTGRFCESRLDVLKVMEHMEKRFGEKMPHLLPAVKDRRMSANFNMLGILAAQNSIDYKEMKRECWSQVLRNRRRSLFSPQTRLKNKCGALVSYLGYGMTKQILGIFYKSGGKVITLSHNLFQEECLRLATSIRAEEFIPDLVIGIFRGGTEVVNCLGFNEAKRVDIVIGENDSKNKERLKNVLKYIPRPGLNLLRRIALWQKGKRNRTSQNLQYSYENVIYESVAEKLLSIADNGNVLVVDDAVDYGVTMHLVLTELRRIHPKADIRSAVITVTTESPIVMPDYYLYNDKTLIRFPWSADV
ncbi:MAG: glycosyltransferase [Duncaniella sp.]|nr:glycosyltransferase [Muribaculum sp.]MCM1255988.1 glycosyltransferase [Duncaniella sp.]